MRQVPSPPRLYFQVINELTSPEASIERIGQMIARDPSATGKLLHLANSAAFGRQIQVSHPTEAVSFLGFEMTKALLLVVHSFSFFEEVPSVRDFLETFWHHSMAVGRSARQVAELECIDPEVAHQAFTAGLLHDFGKLLLAANLAQDYGETLALAQLQNRWPWEIETQIFGATHAELGAYVLALWNLPSPIVDAVAWHHCPTQMPGPTQSFTPLTAVHVANVLDHETRDESPQGQKPAVDLDYLQSVSCADRLADWQHRCQPMPTAAAA
jgi:HD-like signal output (HDOD) protein